MIVLIDCAEKFPHVTVEGRRGLIYIGADCNYL